MPQPDHHIMPDVDTADAINQIKAKEKELLSLIDLLESPLVMTGRGDCVRWLRTGKTQVELGVMAAIRGVVMGSIPE
jgi:hypothetical protein